MEIEIGEYVRTEKGYIIKITDGVKLDMVEFEYAIIGKIIKHSKNIIDLIEVGDYVNGNLIYKDFTIEINPITKNKYLKYMYGFEDVWNDFEIKRIVTHEQFKNIEYNI